MQTSGKIALALLALLGSRVDASAAEAPLPEAIAAPGLTVVLTARAEGQQIYEGKAIGNAPGATAKDIAWLKLEAVSHKGNGTFSDVTTVQRINTVCVQLKDECDRPGTTRGMPYTADYVF